MKSLLTGEMRLGIEILALIGDEQMSGTEVHMALSSPPAQTMKILNKLKNAGLLESSRGYQGGYRVAEIAKHTTLGAYMAVFGTVLSGHRMPDSAVAKVEERLEQSFEQLALF